MCDTISKHFPAVHNLEALLQADLNAKFRHPIKQSKLPQAASLDIGLIHV